MPADSIMLSAAEWNGALDPDAMLRALRQRQPEKCILGRRKLRLFACACLRAWWKELNSNSREALDITERYADGRATRGEFGRAQRISAYDFANAASPMTREESLKRCTVDGATNLLTSGAAIAGSCIGQHLRASR